MQGREPPPVEQFPPLERLYLSPPEVSDQDRTLLLDAFDSNWIAPLGPHVDAFERELAATADRPCAVALSSGTAALHLALRVLEVGPADEVLVPTLTFVATAAAVTYVGARPVFVDSEASSWNIDPELVADSLARRARRGNLPKAVITVDLYGQCADYAPLVAACARYEVPLIEDAAEALGATYRGRPAGSFGDLGVFSFNGNKIITTSGGGMLVSADSALIERSRYLASQAREPARHYEHSEIGYNYRLSNLLAALGRGQLQTLSSRVQRRRAINASYRRALGGLPGVRFMPIAPYGEPNWWLTCLTIDAAAFGASRDDVCVALEDLDIEARPTWKPLHLQRAFAGSEVVGGAIAEGIFAEGLCLPSGSAMTADDVQRVVEGVVAVGTGSPQPQEVPGPGTP
ncbi:MAG: aminotransferase class I/II-fold pyridoxal phosphate-dependent enzyme [Actinobacteria bacterium]|nr:aminotransferase class I/II-fold pyridoxal phosphate-dependent enzyme [Actinomycetota bacterium]